MDVKKLIIKHLDTNDNDEAPEGNYEIESDDDLIEMLNNIRIQNGFTDIFERDNDIYYNFYLVFNPGKEDIHIEGVCNYGEKDDYGVYTIPLTEEQKTDLMWMVIRELLREV